MKVFRVRQSNSLARRNLVRSRARLSSQMKETNSHAQLRVQKQENRQVGQENLSRKKTKRINRLLAQIDKRLSSRRRFLRYPGAPEKPMV